MVESDILSSLGDIGLTQYEAKVYSTLITEGISTAKNISNICGIPYGKIYEVIASLTSKGFVFVLPTKPMKYQAVDPDKVIKLIKLNNTKKIEDAEKIIRKELGQKFKKSKKFTELHGTFWMLNGRMAINKKMEELFEKAKDHIYILTSENGLNRLKYYAEVLKKIHSNGINVVIASKITKNNYESAKYLKFCPIYNINLDNPNHFISIDGKESILFEPLPDDEDLRYGRDAGIWAQNTSFTQFIENFFEMRNTQVQEFGKEIK